MALVNLAKWHGAGNDFLVEVIEHGTAPWWTPSRARAICDRSTGVGADGLLIATMGSEVAMELYNADGSIAEMSGNGIRCLAAAVRRVTNAHWSSLTVHTLAGARTVALEMHSDDHGEGSVDMGPVIFGEPLGGSLGVADVGNPHVVVIDEQQWNDEDRERVADALASQMGGANVEFIRVEDADRVSLRVIERGVGWTQACGTGSCAVAAVAHRAGLCGSDVFVDNPGGTLRVTLADGRATLAGPVQFVANVEWLAA
jgi:diaminopimelate epimerase